MAAAKPDKVLVPCPRCGCEQLEARTAYSSDCRKCGCHLRIQEILHPASVDVPRGPQLKRITCFECEAQLEVPVSAESTICKRCGRYVDLHDYHINSPMAKNFKTKGWFVIEPRGNVFNTEITAGHAVIKGRLLGKLTALGSLIIHTGAEIKGSFTAGRLIIPAANRFSWRNFIEAGSAEIAGELAADLRVKGTVLLKPTARLFGDVEARNLVVEAGAVLVGSVRIDSKVPC